LISPAPLGERGQGGEGDIVFVRPKRASILLKHIIFWLL
jgi:hypothetical protein